MNRPLLGAIEAGGTKFLCAVGTANGEILERIRIPTTDPVETLDQVISFFRDQPVRAMGVASFGPVQIDPASPQYGFVTSTPKAKWAYFDLLGALQQSIPVPFAFDVDVTAAALAEGRWGAAQGKRSFMYVTVGTGIGGAAIVDGVALRGASHPEMGHIRVPHDWARDPFPGKCPFHGDCLEGLACGPALEARWHLSPADLAADHPAWRLQTDYLALGCANWICTIVPETLILGGGVMRLELFPELREKVRNLLNGYFDLPQLKTQLDAYLVPPALGANSGILGALILASRAAISNRSAGL